jgi:uncharacterized membrane protein
MRPDLLAAAWGSAAALAWGIGDFSGGLGARRATSLAVTLVSNPVGLALLVLIAATRGAPAPSSHDALLGVLVGLSGAAGIFLFYEALKRGKMGVAAPLSAVTANVLSVLVSAVSEGAPGVTKWLGFALACAGIVLISRPEGEARTSAASSAVLYAVLSGLSFGVFFSLSAQFTSDVDIGWSLVIVRLTSCLLFYSLALARGELVPSLRLTLEPRSRAFVAISALAGICDSLGNLFFALAAQAGRLDISAVTGSLYPLATVALAVVLLRERFTLSQGAGALLALGAIALIVAA